MCTTKKVCSGRKDDFLFSFQQWWGKIILECRPQAVCHPGVHQNVLFEPAAVWVVFAFNDCVIFWGHFSIL